MLLLLCRIPTPDGLDPACFSERQASYGRFIPFCRSDGERDATGHITSLWLGSDSSGVSLFLKYVNYNQCHSIVFCTALSRNT